MTMNQPTTTKNGKTKKTEKRVLSESVKKNQVFIS